MSIARKFVISLMSNRTRLFFMFRHWIKDWVHFGESINSIKEFCDIFMSSPLMLHYENNIFIFLETKFINFYILKEYLTKEEIKLFNKWREDKKLVDTFTTKITYPKELVIDNNETKISRERLCEWFILFDFCKMINPKENFIKIEKKVKSYIEVLKHIKEEYSFKFIDAIIFSLKKTIQ